MVLLAPRKLFSVNSISIYQGNRSCLTNRVEYCVVEMTNLVRKLFSRTTLFRGIDRSYVQILCITTLCRGKIEPCIQILCRTTLCRGNDLILFQAPLINSRYQDAY